MNEHSGPGSGDDQNRRRSADLIHRFVEFAVRVGRVVDSLPDTRMGRHVAGQLIRSGTSPAANYAEGTVAESRRDFVHKLNIARKELRETMTWLMIIRTGDLLPARRIEDVIDECEQLEKILTSSVLTVKHGPRKDAAE